MAKEMTMGEFLVGKVGLRKATAVAAFVVAWGVYLEKTRDESPTLGGYTKYWGQSLGRTYKERDVFRVCFPDDKDPTRVWSLVRGVYDAKADERGRDLSAARLLALSGSWS